jgi:hypothetical protein
VGFGSGRHRTDHQTQLADGDLDLTRLPHNAAKLQFMVLDFLQQLYLYLLNLK